MTQTNKETIVDRAKDAGLQMILFEGGILILGDKVFAAEFLYTKPFVPPYGTVVAISLDGDEVAQAYKSVNGKVVASVADGDDRLRRTLQMIENPSKKAEH